MSKKLNIKTAADLAGIIDHTVLKPETSLEEVKKMCDQAKEYKFAAVCVNPTYIEAVVSELAGTDVAPCCVIGFSLGATLPEVKGYETREAVERGATEVDMLINVGAVKNADWETSYRDIKSVVDAANGRALVKVIIETALLTDEEKVKICTIAKEAGADFVKTSTGFNGGGATVEDIKLMRKTVGDDMGVKAAGGIRNAEDAMALVRAGANRLGTSGGMGIVTEK